jgi:hypothetical protein
MTLTITINQEQLNAIRENLNLPYDVSDERCVEIFITENTYVDRNGDGF